MTPADIFLPEWPQRKAGLTERVVFHQSGLCVRYYHVPFPVLNGKRLFFCSDLHIQQRRIRSFFPFTSWCGVELYPAIQKIIHTFDPDYLLLGGDLITDTVLLDRAMSLFQGLEIPSLAVLGNWEGRHKAFSSSFWRKRYRAEGVDLLINDLFESDDLRIYGTDDLRRGNPVFPAEFPSDHKVNCILMHNPDTLDLIPRSLLKQTHLVFAGHTHGGQVRLPGFGSLYSSTKKWKRFECGAYRNRYTGTKMIISAGMGTSACPIRIFDPPEVCCVSFSE